MILNPPCTTPTPAKVSQCCITTLLRMNALSMKKGLNLFNVMIKNTIQAYQNMPLAHFPNGIDIIFALHSLSQGLVIMTTGLKYTNKLHDEREPVTIRCPMLLM